MRTTRYWMIVPANGTPRIVKRRPWNLQRDEIAAPIDVVRPDGWGKVADVPVTITLPEPPAIEAPAGGES